jgi:hypothetical protein
MSIAKLKKTYGDDNKSHRKMRRMSGIFEAAAHIPPSASKIPDIRRKLE